MRAAADRGVPGRRCSYPTVGSDDFYRIVLPDFAVLVAVIIQSGKMYTRTGTNLAGATMFLILLGHTLMLILPATVAHGTRDALARKAR